MGDHVLMCANVRCFGQCRAISSQKQAVCFVAALTRNFGCEVRAVGSSSHVYVVL